MFAAPSDYSKKKFLSNAALRITSPVFEYAGTFSGIDSTARPVGGQTNCSKPFEGRCALNLIVIILFVVEEFGKID